MEKNEKKRRRGKSFLTKPESQKRKEPKRKDGSTYVVPVSERKIFHIESESPFFNPKGKKLSKPHIVKLENIREYKQFVIHAHKSELEFKILHDPRPYLGMSREKIIDQDRQFLEEAKPETKKK